MAERMTSADVAFLHRESRTSPQHVGQLAVLRAPSAGFDYDRLVRLIEERISLAPRYRQKVVEVPGHLANPLWVDDPGFDIGYHVRRSALPRPGTDAELLEFCARIESRMLDRGRPLWEIYLVEGLSDGRLAILTKTHEAIVNEHDGIDLTQVILDTGPAPRRTVEAIWMPQPEPGGLGLVRDAVLEAAHRPLALVETARAALHDLEATAGRVMSLAGGIAAAGRSLVQLPASSPLSVQLSEQRRLAVARTQLADYRSVRDAFGGTVNDVMLAVVAGALRGWLLARAEPLRPGSAVRALVPVSVSDDAISAAGVAAPGASASGATGPDMPSSGGVASGGVMRSGSVRPLLVDLPVGEGDAVLRLAQLRYAMATHKASGFAVGADSIAALSGFAPPTLHALGARASAGLTRRMFHLVVTNVPGPQWPLYAAGARMVETFPIVPLGQGQAVSIAVSSYDGGVFYGLNGDRDAMLDIAVLAELIEDALAELVALAQAMKPPTNPPLTPIVDPKSKSTLRSKSTLKSKSLKGRGSVRP